MTPPSRSRNPFAVLRRHREYRLFWAGQTTSLVGTWMQSMAQGWLALQLSDSALVVGLVATMNALPILLFSFAAGALADRRDRLQIVRAAQWVFLLEATALWALTLTGTITIPLLLVLAAVHGAAATVEIPARQALVFELVGPDDLQPAIALNSSGFNLARVIGPALGGVVIARLGIAWCFGINAVSYGIVLAGLWRIARLRRARTVVERGKTGVTASLRYFMQPGLVRDLLLMVTVGAIGCGPMITLMPVYARERLALGAGGYGLLLSALGIGGVVGALLLAGPLSQARRGRLLTVSAILNPALLVVLAVVRTPWIAMTLLPLAGLTLITFNSLANVVLQTLVPDEYRGRLMGLYSLIIVGLTQSVGALWSGALARAVGVHWPLAIGAFVTMLYSAVVVRRRTELRRM
jgi:MFS family permease